MSKNTYKHLGFFLAGQLPNSKIRRCFICILLAYSDAKQVEKIIKDTIESAINKKNLDSEYDLIKINLDNFNLSAIRTKEEAPVSYILGKFSSIDINRDEYTDDILITIILPYDAEIASNLSLLKLNYNYESVTVDIPDRITEAGIEVINNYNKEYVLYNIRSEDIEKIDPDKIHSLVYNCDEKYICKAINNLKISNEIHILSSNPPISSKKEKLLYYQSGSLSNNSQNINFNFRYNLFFTISHHLLNLSDQLVLNCSDDLLSNHFALMKIAKFSHRD